MATDKDFSIGSIERPGIRKANKMRFFQSLRGKLTLTYTLVTVLALLALEILMFLAIITLTALLRIDQRNYLNDVVSTLNQQARPYLQPGQEDLPGLQQWLDQTYQAGYASLEPMNSLDSPAAKITRGEPMIVLSPERTVLAQSPPDANNIVGRLYSPPNLPGSEAALERAMDGQMDVLRLSVTDRHGKMLMMTPITQDGYQTPLVGVIVVTVDPPPPILLSFGPTLLAWVMATGLLLVIGVAPFGTLFGLVMSRRLTRRLKVLTQAADTWSEGVFQALPPDRSRDEISTLGKRMWHMAERIQDLLQSQQQLAALEERNRLARELHDTVKQQNFATLMQVRAARNLFSVDPEKAKQHMLEAEELIKSSQQELNLIIAELHPAELKGKGLSGALAQYLQTWSQHAFIPADFHTQGDHRLPLEQEQTLYRVAQEALSNVARHSRASAVRVTLTFEDNQVTLVVNDNGSGFNTQTPSQGFGLQSMSERLDKMGGRLNITSSDEGGTTLTAQLPVQRLSHKQE